MDRLRSDPSFSSVDLSTALDPSLFTGRCPEQVDAFVEQEIDPVRKAYPKAVGGCRELDV
jgi:adenylosuccinate lyase